MSRAVPPPRTRRLLTSLGALVPAAVAVVSMAACLPSSGGTAGSGADGLPRTDTPGGTLRTWSIGPVETWDPQRLAAGQDVAFATRTFVRTLTAYAPAAHGTPGRLVGDLAEDTGSASADLRTWSFTVRRDAAWQDGSPVTCADVKYGVSRSFASGVIVGGPAYADALLDIPKNADGSSIYRGPYDSSPAGAAGRVAYDRAVTCSGRIVTFRLARPVADFAEVVTLPAFAPVKASEDRRAAGTYAVFSDGPYILAGGWNPGTGGTFTRNPAWTRASDPVRRALPAAIEYTEGMDIQTIVQRITADEGGGATAVALTPAPPAVQLQVLASAPLRDRYVDVGTGLVDYIAPNVRSPVFKNAAARQAFALATDRDAYVTALGGPSAAEPVTSLIPPGLLVPTKAATTSASSTPVPTGSPVARARALLASSGATLPVRITVAYRSGPTMDKAMAALLPGWTAAGFAPTLKPVANGYFSVVSAPSAATVDAFWTNWAPEWASASTILQPLFDSRVNVSASGSGRDYGYVEDTALNGRMDALSSVADRSAREAGWAAVDEDLRAMTAYVPLAERRALYVAGSAVRNLSADEVLGGAVDLATIGVAQ